jgi:hypothetical protein
MVNARHTCTIDTKDKLVEWVSKNYETPPSFDKTPKSFAVIQYEEIEVKVETTVKLG